MAAFFSKYTPTCIIANSTLWRRRAMLVTTVGQDIDWDKVAEIVQKQAGSPFEVQLHVPPSKSDIRSN